MLFIDKNMEDKKIIDKGHVKHKRIDFRDIHEVYIMAIYKGEIKYSEYIISKKNYYDFNVDNMIVVYEPNNHEICDIKKMDEYD